MKVKNEIMVPGIILFVSLFLLFTATTMVSFDVYGVNNMSCLGEAHTQTLIDYIAAFPPMDEKLDCKTVQEFVLLGDPSLMIGGYS